MPTEIDILMDLDPLEMTKSDIDAIIAYHRNNRAKEGADRKMKKAPAVKPSKDLTELILGMAKKEAPAAVPKPSGGPNDSSPHPKPSGIRRI